MSKELSNLLAAVEKTVVKEEGEYKKERKEAREYALNLAEKLDPIRRRRFADLDKSSQTAIMSAMEAADELLRKTCGRRIFEPQKNAAGERMDKFNDPVENTMIWSFMDRLKRQSATISAEGDIVEPPPRQQQRPNSTGAVPAKYQEDTGEKLGDVVRIVEKKKKLAAKKAK